MKKISILLLSLLMVAGNLKAMLYKDSCDKVREALFAQENALNDEELFNMVQRCKRVENILSSQYQIAFIRSMQAYLIGLMQTEESLGSQDSSQGTNGLINFDRREIEFDRRDPSDFHGEMTKVESYWALFRAQQDISKD